MSARRPQRALWQLVAAYWVCAGALLFAVSVLREAVPRWAPTAVWVAALVGLFLLLARERSRESASRSRLEPIAVPAAYAIVTLLFFLPVLPRIGSETLGPSDGMQVLWDAWWLARAAAEGRSPLFTDMVFAPIGAPLVFHMFVPLQSAAIALLEPFTGPALAFNLMAYAAFPLAGSACYWLGRHLCWGRVASAVGGLVLMWSPFLTAKLEWPNHSYCGFLALFALALSRATPFDRAPVSRRAQAELALAAVLLLLGGDVGAVFAANLALVRFACACAVSRSPLGSARQWTLACAPAAVALLPFLAMAAYYALSFDFRVSRGSMLGPGLIDYALPLFQDSLHREWFSALTGIDHTPAIPRDRACYLGVAVLSLALCGWVLQRQRREMRFWLALFLFGFVISLGPRLVLATEALEVFGLRVPLPFALWERIPLLGMLAPSGRYSVLAYLGMGVAVGGALHALRVRFGRLSGSACAAAAACAIAFDFAFIPQLGPLPPIPPLMHRPGRVLDARTYRGDMMYFQTHHERPLVGGYLSRPALDAIRFYRSKPCIGWLMYGDPPTPCDRTSLSAALAELDVGDVVLGANDLHGRELERMGFPLAFSGDDYIVLRVPPEQAEAERPLDAEAGSPQ